MESYEPITKTSIGISLVALIVAVIIFIAVWIIGGVLFNFFDSLRGLGGEKLQEIFRELFIPGLGGYLAMVSANSWFQRASIKFVFFGFTAIILVLVGAYIGFVGPLAGKIGEDIWGLLLSILSILSAVAGAYIYAKEKI